MVTTEAIVEQSPGTAARRPLLPRLGSAIAGAWAAFVGILPHVLHHVGPLAGAALLAGTTGRVAFAALGFILSIPFLLRLRRRFGSWVAPGLALAIMAVMFSISSFVIGPLISGEDSPRPAPGIEQPDEHAEHH